MPHWVLHVETCFTAYAKSMFYDLIKSMGEIEIGDAVLGVLLLRFPWELSSSLWSKTSEVCDKLGKGEFILQPNVFS